jgi:NADPH-dependent F420 reductase
VEAASVKIAILGGTGKEGAGLGQRWALIGHEIVIGSRDARRARDKARELNSLVGKDAASGMTNLEATQAGELIIIALPYEGLAKTLPEMKNACRGKVVVSTVVPLSFGGLRLFSPPPAGSAAEEARTLLGAEARVVAAFHHIAAHELASVGHPIDCDLLLLEGLLSSS